MPITKEAKRVIIIFAIVMVVFMAVPGWLYYHSPRTLTFYYGNECPHCHNVLNWMSLHNATAATGMKLVEVWDDKDNAATFAGVVRKCGMDQGVVPVLVAENGACYVGEVEITDYLSQRLGIANATGGI